MRDDQFISWYPIPETHALNQSHFPYSTLYLSMCIYTKLTSSNYQHKRILAGPIMQTYHNHLAI